ncbi:HEAT repeat domain-containing protein [Planctomycetota bacterium]
MIRDRFPALIGGLSLGFLMFSTSVLYAGEPDFPIRAKTTHYEVQAEVSKSFAETTGKVAEGLYADFYAMLGTEFTLEKASKPLKIVCLDGKTDTIGKHKFDIMRPGLYKFSSRGNSVVYVCRKGIEYRGGDWGPVRHEAGHQLIHMRFGILPSVESGHFWFHEGMACYLEGTGPYRINASVQLMRLYVLRKAYGHKGIPSLQKVLELDKDKVNQMGSSKAYALAWSFIHYLVHGDSGTLRKQFLRYIKKMQIKGNEKKSLDVFREVFPNLKEVESGWVKYIHLLMRGKDLSKNLTPIGTGNSFFPDFKNPKNLYPVLEKEQNNSGQITQEDKKTALNGLKEISKIKGDKRKTKVKEIFGSNPKARAALAEIIRKNTSSYRNLAAIAFGCLGDREYLDVCVDRALKDQDPKVRKSAAEAIRTINEGCAPQAFIAALKNPNIRTAVNAVEALGIIKDRQSLKPLLLFLEKTIDKKAMTKDTSHKKTFRERSGINQLKKMKENGWGIPEVDTRDPQAAGIMKYRAAIQKSIITSLKLIAPGHSKDTAQSWLEWGKKNVR